MQAGTRSTNGPDWTDVELMMTAIQQFHGVKVSVGMELYSGDVGSGLIIVAGAESVTGLPDPAKQPVIGMRFPTHQHVTLSAAVYRLLCQLDYKCGEVFWEQSKMDT